MRTIPLALAAFGLASSSAATALAQETPPAGDASGTAVAAVAPPTVTDGVPPATPNAAPPQADSGARASATPPNDSKPPEKLPWRGTAFDWDNTATTQTLGVGQDYQSRNPTYVMTLKLRPRYYVFDQSGHNISLRADAGVFREFTDSDTTTRRGEWSFTDAVLQAAYNGLVYSQGDVQTLLYARAPNVTLPTSKNSSRNGMIFGLGGTAGLIQNLPLLGSKADALNAISLYFLLGYEHTFTKAEVATNDEINYYRMDVSGRSIPSDQLSGAPLAKHQMSVTLADDIYLVDVLVWESVFGWRPTWDYAVGDSDVCISTLTGCATPERIDNPQTYGVTTVFSSSLIFTPLSELTLEAGYANAANQLGPDGRRRNMLYSPDARFYFTAEVNLDEVYKAATGFGKTGVSAQWDN